VNGIQIQYPVFFPKEVGIESAKKFKQATGIDITYWNGFVCDIKKQKDKIDIKILNQQVQRVKKDFHKTHFYPTDIEPAVWFSEKSSPRIIECKTAWKRLNIDSNGNIVICNDHADMIAGNLLKMDFQSIWNGETYRTFRRMMKKENYMEMCQYCTYSYL
jgi:radical SAM protein with 4Fe4S-binding SPASM domain